MFFRVFSYFLVFFSVFFSGFLLDFMFLRFRVFSIPILGRACSFWVAWVAVEFIEKVFSDLG